MACGAAERFAYSNTNYIVLGLLIERVTGNRYATDVNRRIIGPLHLGDTYFPSTDPYLRGPHSKAYVQWPDGSMRDFSDFNMSSPGRRVNWSPRWPT